MLIYNQAYDLYHTVFRILQILNNYKGEDMEVEKLRILDFYLAFPSELLDIQSFKGFTKHRKMLENKRNSYERVLDRKRLFIKMENIQISAIKALISFGIIDAKKFKQGKVKRTDLEIHLDLLTRIQEANKSNQELVDLITESLANMNLYGHLGLKHRTDLIEFNYDAV